MTSSLTIPHMHQSQMMGLQRNPLQVRSFPTRSSASLYRQRITHIGFQCQALDGETTPDGLIVLPVFTGSSILLPTSRGILRAFEPRYLHMFNHLRATSEKGDGKGARFMHILSPKIAPPAMLDNSLAEGVPAIGCCAVIESMQTAADNSIIVEYSGHRRTSLLHLVQKSPVFPENNNFNPNFTGDTTNDAPLEVLYAAGEWYDDVEPEQLDPISGTVSSIYAAERDVAGIVQQIARLSKRIDPENSQLPEALSRYAPPSSGTQQQRRPTSYDALKAASHPAATSIEMWRRHGSVYNNQNATPQEAHADPYTEVSERLGRLRRQEMYSFAATQLLQLGVPEAAALLLTRDTAGRLQFVLEAARPYLAQLSAEAALKGALE